MVLPGAAFGAGGGAALLLLFHLFGLKCVFIAPLISTIWAAIYYLPKALPYEYAGYLLGLWGVWLAFGAASARLMTFSTALKAGMTTTSAADALTPLTSLTPMLSSIFRAQGKCCQPAANRNISFTQPGASPAQRDAPEPKMGRQKHTQKATLKWRQNRTQKPDKNPHSNCTPKTS